MPTQPTTPRLPIPGQDPGNWGTILNTYLSQAHKPDGTLKDNTVTASTIAPGAITQDTLSQPIKDQLDIIAGQQGATGPSGPQGPTGATGPEGPAGASGTPGTAGQHGATGASGTPGASGIPGSQGATGASGTPGTPGQAGATGASGTPGQIGATGATGVAGATGPAGQDGQDGAGIEIAGSVATYANLPSGLTPSNAGEGYLVESDGKLYIWSGTSFPANGNGVEFRGPQGATGPAGTNGATGASGTPGTPGTHGATGATGASGTPGQVGATGATGAASTVPGATGPIGATGAPGTTSWAGIADKPTTFTPSAHNHAAGDINSGTLGAARLPAQSSMVVITPATARPTARTDISVFWIGHATQPINALAGDIWMPDLGGG